MAFRNVHPIDHKGGRGTSAHGRRATCALPPAPLFESDVRAPWAHSTVCLMHAVTSRRWCGR